MEDATDRPSYEPELAEPPTPSAKQKYSAVQRLWMMFTSPNEVFQDIRIKPTWVLCMIVYVAVVTVGSLVVYSYMDHEANIRGGLAMMNIEVPEEQIEEAVQKAEDFWYRKPLIIGLVAWPIILFLSAGVFFLMLKMMGSESGYVETLSTMLHAYWPSKTVYSVLLAALVAAKGTVTEFGMVRVLKSSVAGFLSGDISLPMMTFTSFIDVFRIWGVVLLIIGLGIVAGISRGKAIAAALIPWIFLIVLWTALSALPSLFTG
jgi:hypothetical protein